MAHDKHLPPGTFVVMRNLPSDATNESVSEYLSQYLPEVGPERIDVRNFDTWSSAIISLSNEAAAAMFRWAFEGCVFPGFDKPLVLTTFKTSGRP